MEKGKRSLVEGCRTQVCGGCSKTEGAPWYQNQEEAGSPGSCGEPSPVDTLDLASRTETIHYLKPHGQWCFVKAAIGSLGSLTSVSVSPLSLSVTVSVTLSAQWPLPQHVNLRWK